MAMLRYTERLTPLMVRLASCQHLLPSSFLFFLFLFIFVTLLFEAFGSVGRFLSVVLSLTFSALPQFSYFFSGLSLTFDPQFLSPVGFLSSFVSVRLSSSSSSSSAY